MLSQDATRAKGSCRAIEQNLERIKAEVISRRSTHEALTNQVSLPRVFPCLLCDSSARKQLKMAQQPNLKAKSRLKQALIDKRELEHECLETVATWRHRVSQVAARLTQV